MLCRTLVLLSLILGGATADEVATGASPVQNAGAASGEAALATAKGVSCPIEGGGFNELK
jgi:hypothetical protein